PSSCRLAESAPGSSLARWYKFDLAVQLTWQWQTLVAVSVMTSAKIGVDLKTENHQLRKELSEKEANSQGQTNIINNLNTEIREYRVSILKLIMEKRISSKDLKSILQLKEIDQQILDAKLLEPLYDFTYYIPPFSKGDIYVLIDKNDANNNQNSLYVCCQWGSWNKQATIDVAQYKGMLLQLRHLQNDSVTLKIQTKGKIIKGPYQDINMKPIYHNEYKLVSW
ncbi:MAG: hypothetical protein MUO63_05595, partial [Desulfobulbaceae bacterium]|nr:hypothetical protein [Desulfobulbaceae bacterium]